MTPGAFRYRILRQLGKGITRMAALLTWERMPPFVGAAAIIEREGRILMIRDPAQRQLVLPGGHLRWAESIAEGLRREVWEETGYRVEPGTVVRIYSGREAPVDLGIVRIVMTARIAGGAERSSAEGNVEWHDPAELARGPWRDARVVAEWRENAEERSSIAAESRVHL